MTIQIGYHVDYELLDQETIYKGRVFELARVRFRLPDGKEHTYDLVWHHGAVTVLPIDDQGNVYFVQQYRIGAQKWLLELPAGVLEEGESIEEAAMREVQEEIGLAAGTMEKLGEFYMVPGYSTEKLHAFLATDLFDSSLPADDDEFLERKAIPLKEVMEMIYRGEIEDGKTLAALLLAMPRLQRFLAP